MSLLECEGPVCLSGVHSGSVHVCRWNGDGSYLLSAGSDRKIVLWKSPSAQQYETHSRTSTVASVSASSSSSFGGSVDGVSSLFVHAFPSSDYHGRSILDVSISSNHSAFISAGVDRTFYVWDVAKDTVVRRLRGHEGSIFSCQFNGALNGDSLCASGGFDCAVNLWDLRAHSSKPIQSMHDATDSVLSVKWTSFSLVSASLDGCIRQYDVRAANKITDFVGHTLTHTQISHDEKVIAASITQQQQQQQQQQPQRPTPAVRVVKLFGLQGNGEMLRECIAQSTDNSTHIHTNTNTQRQSIVNSTVTHSTSASAFPLLSHATNGNTSLQRGVPQPHTNTAAATSLSVTAAEASTSPAISSGASESASEFSFQRGVDQQFDGQLVKWTAAFSMDDALLFCGNSNTEFGSSRKRNSRTAYFSGFQLSSERLSKPNSMTSTATPVAFVSASASASASTSASASVPLPIEWKSGMQDLESVSVSSSSNDNMNVSDTVATGSDTVTVHPLPFSSLHFIDCHPLYYELLGCGADSTIRCFRFALYKAADAQT